MTSPDLVLLHAPSIYDFRQETVLYGPLGDFVLPPFALDRYPLAHGALAGPLEAWLAIREWWQGRSDHQVS